MNQIAISVETKPVFFSAFDTSILTGQLAPSSIAMYQRDFHAYLDYADSFTHAMQPATLARWRTHLAEQSNKSPNTINRMLSAVKCLVREAAAQGYTSHEVAQAFDAVKGVKVKAMKGQVRSGVRVKISPEDMRRLCITPNANTLPGLMHRAFLFTLASSALRVSEAVMLKPTQIKERIREDGRKGYILMVQGKNDEVPREAPLSVEAYQYIQYWLDARTIESDYIFTGFTGRGGRGPRTEPIRPISAWEMVRRYAKRCGLEQIKPHDFRRFVGTQLAAVDIRKAQKALGHKSIETTARHYVLDELEVGLTDNLM